MKCINSVPFLLLMIVLLLALPVMAGGVDTIDHLPFPGSITAATWNPALLGFSPYRVNVQLNSLSLNLWTNAWTPNQILPHINEYWDEDYKEELIDSIVGDSLITGLDLKSGIYFGSSTWAVSSNLRGGMQLGVDKDIFHLLLYGTGTDPDFHLDLEDTFAKGSAIVDTAFHKAFSIPELAEILEWDTFYAGAGLHFLAGLAMLDMRADFKFTSVFDEGEEDAYFLGEGDIDALYAVSGVDGRGGLGAALDVGVWGEPFPGLGVGLSLTNLGFIHWDGLYRSYYRGTYKFGHPLSEVEDEEDFEEVLEELQDPRLIRNPISVQAGAYYRLHPRVELAGGLGFHEDPTSHVSLTAGSRFHAPKFFPITLAMEYSSHKGSLSLATSLGFKIMGFEPLTITFSDILLLTGGGKQGTICLHTSLRF